MCTGRCLRIVAGTRAIGPPLGGTSTTTPCVAAGPLQTRTFSAQGVSGVLPVFSSRKFLLSLSLRYLPRAAQEELRSHATIRVAEQAPGDSPPAGEQVWSLEGSEVALTVRLVASEAELQEQVAPLLGRRRATEAAALAAIDVQMQGVAAVAIEGVPEESCLGEGYNDVYLSAGRHAGWLRFASEAGKHLYYYSVFGAWFLHSDYTSAGQGVAAVDSGGALPLGEAEWRCYARGKWSEALVATSLLSTQDDVTAYRERRENERREAQVAEDEATAERRRQMVQRIQQKVEQYLTGEAPSFLAPRQPVAPSTDSSSDGAEAAAVGLPAVPDGAEAAAVGLPMSAHASPGAGGAASGPPFPRMGVSIEGVLLIQTMFDDVITDDTTTSDVCHLIIRPLTCEPQYRDLATATHQLHGWYSHRYVLLQSDTERQTEGHGETEGSAPSGSMSWCDLLCTDPTKADWVAQATVFFSHAWSLKFREVVSALQQLASQRPDDAEQIYFWFDVCCVNQHVSHIVPPEWWSTTFQSAISAIGNTVMMLSPWDQPVVLTRSWCLWELFCTAAAEGTRFSMCLCPSQLAALELALKSNPSAVLNAISRIDVQNAQAGQETDRAAILRAVESTPNGVEGINQLAMQEVRKWLLQTARRLMSESDLLGDAAAETTPSYTEQSVLEGHLLSVCLGHYLGAWSDALTLLRPVAAGYEGLMGTHSQQALGARNQLAVATEACGDLPGAKAEYEAVLQRQLETIGPLNSGTLATQKNLAAVLYQLGDVSCAALFRAVFEGQTALHGGACSSPRSLCLCLCLSLSLTQSLTHSL